MTYTPQVSQNKHFICDKNHKLMVIINLEKTMFKLQMNLNYVNLKLRDNDLKKKI
jgi:hypothetical protein